jgi:hypothetical protein
VDDSSVPQADPLTALRACRRTNVGVPSDVGEVLAAMTHGSATVPDLLHPLHTQDVGTCELPLPRELEPVAFAMRQPRQQPCPRQTTASR